MKKKKTLSLWQSGPNKKDTVFLKTVPLGHHFKKQVEICDLLKKKGTVFAAKKVENGALL